MLETAPLARDADRAAERHQVVGDLARLGGGPVQHSAEPAGRVEGSEHAHVMAASEELLGERLDVPVHAPLIAPGVWRDEGDSHETAKGSQPADPGCRASRLGPGEADEDQQVGRPDLQQERAGVVREGAERIAATAPSRPARIAGRPRSQALERSRRSTARRREREQRQEDEDDRPDEAVRGELQAALGDVGQVVEPAGVEHRAGQVGVGAGERDPPAPAARPPRTGRRAPAAACGGGAGAAIAAAATAAPSGRTIAAPTSAPKRPAAKTNASGKPGGEEGERRAPRATAAARSRPAPPRCRRRRAPRAAPPARCRSRRSARRARDSARAATARSAASRRSRRPRRRGPSGPRPQRAPDSRANAREGRRREQRRAEDRQQLFDPLARLERRAEQAAPAAGRRRRAPPIAHPQRAPPARERGDAAPSDHQPGEQAKPDHRPASLGDHRHAVAQRFDRGRLDRPLCANRLARHLGGTATPKPFEDRRGDVGREHVAVEPGAVRGEIRRRSPARRFRSPVPRPRRGGGCSMAISRSLPRRSADEGRQRRAGSPLRTSKVGAGCGWGPPLNFFGEAAAAVRGSGAEKVQDVPTPTGTPTPAARRVDVSRPGTMSAGADSARATTACHQAAQSRPSGGKLGVVEGVEDAVALRDVEIGLLSGHRPQPRAHQPRRKPEPRQLLKLVPRGTNARSRVCGRVPGGVERLVLFGASRRQPRSHRKS